MNSEKRKQEQVQLMTGNEAVARGVFEAGCTAAAAYPGTPSTEILQELSRYPGVYCEWSPNEKVALEAAGGASLAGARAFCSMKHVGLNVAADPLFTIGYTGINGGLVISTSDEPGMHSSQNEQDNRLYAEHAKIPLIVPSDSQESRDYMIEAFRISEEFDTAVLFRTTTRVCHSKSRVRCGERQEVEKRPYVKSIKKNLMTPGNARPKHEIVEGRLEKLRAYAEKTHLNRIEWAYGGEHGPGYTPRLEQGLDAGHPAANAAAGTGEEAAAGALAEEPKQTGIISTGIAYQYAREVFGDTVSYLKIGFSYPLPEVMIRHFADSCDKIIIIEENEPFIEHYVRRLGISCIGKDQLPLCGELSPEIIREALSGITASEVNHLDPNPELTDALQTVDIPPRPPALCPGCPHRGLFHVLSQYPDTVVSTDIGCYTLGAFDPLNVGDFLFCMGSSISAAIGFQRAESMAGTHNGGISIEENTQKSMKKKVFAVIGDSTFFHSGMTGLADAVYNKTPIAVFILDNRITAMTGHQDNPGTGRTLMGAESQKISIPGLVKALGVPDEHIRVVNPNNLKRTREAAEEAYQSDDLFVIIAEAPCALLPEVKRRAEKRFYRVKTDVCTGCRACLEIGCPAIHVDAEAASDSGRHGIAGIDPDMCTACGVCFQVCDAQAIVMGKRGN